MAADQITLCVPARSEYAKTVRMTAAALVSRSMSYDEVDDVRIAAEEAFIYAVDTLPADGEVCFNFGVSDDELTIGVALGDDDIESHEATERRTAYATFILESVCDSFEFLTGDTGMRLQLAKRVGTGHGDRE
jgi:serine/threonine-protein kinase RsbW